MTRMKGASALGACSVVMYGGHSPRLRNVVILWEGVSVIEIGMQSVDWVLLHTDFLFLGSLLWMKNSQNHLQANG